MARALARRRYTPTPKIRYRTRTVKVARRGVSAAARLARQEKHTLTAVGSAAALGFMEKRNMSVPHIEALGVAGTLGGAAYLVARYTKSKTAAHVATGLLSVAAYKLTSEGDEDDETEGDFVEGEYDYDERDERDFVEGDPDPSDDPEDDQG